MVSRKRRIKVKKVFTPAFCISLVLITVFWNGIVNQSLLNVKPVIDRTLSQGFNLLPSQNQSLWSRWISGTGANPEASATGTTALETLRASNLEYGKQIRITPSQASLTYQLKPANIANLDPVFGSKVAATYDNLVIFGRTFFQLFAALGILFLFMQHFRKRSPVRKQTWIPSASQSLDLIGIGIGALMIGLIARISVTLSGVYNPERTALQIVLVLVIPTVIAVEYALFRKQIIQIFLAIPVLFFLAVLLFQATSLGGYISGSDTTRISSLQGDYSPFVISEGERRASQWLADSVPARSLLQTDSRGFLALLQNGRRSNSSSLDPVNLAGNAYIYAANSSVVGKVARASPPFLFPEDYLNQNYHLIYSSNRARIYH
jgi:hypothetical protein